MRDSIPIGTVDFNSDDATTEEIGEILDKIRDIDGLVAYEHAHNEQYTVARMEDE